MAAKSRRDITSFGLSFLDIMFCGFGAVVLLVLLLSGKVISFRQQQVDHGPELVRQRVAARLAAEEREQLDAALRVLEQDLVDLEQRRERAADALVSFARQGAAADSPQLEEISRAKAELKKLEAEKQLLVQQVSASQQASKIRSFEGEGNRQYLTGLKLGGQRVLILIDGSASMLDRKIVNIVRLKIRSDELRRVAPKWQRVVSTVEWLLANFPAETSIAGYLFNQEVQKLGSDGREWVPVTDRAAVSALVSELRRVAPLGGTNLEKMLKTARSLTPRPDNIILITDGLPTTDRDVPRTATVTSRERARLFERAITHLPPGIPVNTILFPMEGDPLAAVLFWRLGVESGGAFITPTRDWP
jgi:hypothetical protein